MMGERVEVDPTKGIICPWCPTRTSILKCIHNPFKLMDEVERLKKQNYDLVSKTGDLELLTRIIKRMIVSK